MEAEAFDIQPTLSGKTLDLCPLAREHFDGLYAAASDPNIWAGHPSKTRYRRDVFASYFSFLLNNGGTLAAVDRSRNTVVGCSRYYVAPDMPDSISIGFTFLNASYWGGETNFEMKRLMLDHAFGTFSEVWFHIDPTNIRSQKATAKLGARPLYDARLDLAGIPADWSVLKLTKQDWAQTCALRR